MTHKQISFIKSGFRIFGYILLSVLFWKAALVLVISEVLGIVEEIGEK